MFEKSNVVQLEIKNSIKEIEDEIKETKYKKNIKEKEIKLKKTNIKMQSIKLPEVNKNRKNISLIK